MHHMPRYQLIYVDSERVQVIEPGCQLGFQAPGHNVTTIESMNQLATRTSESLDVEISPIFRLGCLLN